MASPRINFVPNRQVSLIATDGVEFTVSGNSVEGAGVRRSAGGPFALRASQVVNATWERRLALDRTMSDGADPDVLYRLKYRIIAGLPQELQMAPSATMVIGRYGDVVVRPDATAYLSWYPAGLRGWSHDLEPPRSWDAASRGFPPAALAEEVVEQTLTGIANWLPGVRDVRLLCVDAGVIVARGYTDVDDFGSGLHDRTRVGVSSRGGYHSVDPGKLTTGPLFAMEVADRVESAAMAAV